MHLSKCARYGAAAPGRPRTADWHVLRYQSIVALRPSSNDTRGSKPKHSRARVESTIRRGWPSGFDASHLFVVYRDAVKEGAVFFFFKKKKGKGNQKHRNYYGRGKDEINSSHLMSSPSIL